MRTVLFILLNCLLLTSSYAHIVKVFIQNHSLTPIMIEKINGAKLTIPPKGFIALASFTNHSEVKNYVNGKYTCSWYINKHPDRAINMIGISYGHPQDKWTCISKFEQRTIA